MILWNALVVAVREVRRNALRSFLTMLGIVIGVAAVITMVTVGQGAAAQVTAQIESLGANLLIIRPGLRLGPGAAAAGAPFDVADAEAIAVQIRHLRAVAPQSSQGVQAIVGNRNWSTLVSGVTLGFFEVREWSVLRGRRFLAGEMRAGTGVCVIGQTVVRELFGLQDPLGATLRLGKLGCEVVGILEAKGQGGMGADQDNVVLVPLRTYQRRIAGNTDVAMIQVSVRDGRSTERAQRDIEALLRERRRIDRGEDDDFTVIDTREIAEALSGTTRVLTMLLGAVAGVSLVVGGIGIMNIMLVSVTERTREIGIRLAIGALEREVLTQFLVEAAVLSSLGGLFGIGLALALSAALAYFMAVPFLPDVRVIAAAVAFSAAVGLGFGFFPARRAASLDPIEALRYE